MKRSARAHLWLPVAALSIGIGWGVALGCASSASQLPSSELQPPAESGAVSTSDLLARVGQAYERGLDQISDAESDLLMDDLGVLGRRAGAGDAAAFRGLARMKRGFSVWWCWRWKLATKMFVHAPRLRHRGERRLC